jgi:hypothetical protein
MQWERTKEWLERAKDVLIQEGFNDTILQTIKQGQVFGLVKKVGDIWEMHVRGFNDGRLEAEIEISRDYFEHLDDRYRRDASLELTHILDAYQIPYQTNGNLPQVEVTLYPPAQVTPWKPVVAIITLAAFLIWLGRQEG